MLTHPWKQIKEARPWPESWVDPKGMLTAISLLNFYLLEGEYDYGLLWLLHLQINVLVDWTWSTHFTMLVSLSSLSLTFQNMSSRQGYRQQAKDSFVASQKILETMYSPCIYQFNHSLLEHVYVYTYPYTHTCTDTHIYTHTCTHTYTKHKCWRQCYTESWST